MIGVLDACVIADVLFGDDGAPEIARWVVNNLPNPIVSDIVWDEVVGALGIRVRRGDADPAEATALLNEFTSEIASWDRIVVHSSDIADAIAFVSDLTRPLRFVDAIHVAVARRLDATLITTDRQQYRAALELGVPAINTLEQST